LGDQGVEGGRARVWTFVTRMGAVYSETSFISLLVANSIWDLATAANQQSTRDWWRLRRGEFVCVASSEVVREASRGDPQEVRKRLEILGALTVLRLTPEGASLTRALLATEALPARAQTDAAHLAIAAAAKADYLLTWNCGHLANVQILRRLEVEAKRVGWKLPMVYTPPELMGDSAYETESDS
jgi:predicted nucleic acid-binding protein